MDLFLPIVTVILLWWSATGFILWLARGWVEELGKRLLLVTVIAAISVAAMIISSANDAVWTAYLGFLAALGLWSWVEFTFLAGIITGSRKMPCPEHSKGWARFVLAYKTLDHHEYVLVAMLGLIAFIDWIGVAGMSMTLKTFTLLWAMRIGAKFAVFSGVPGFSDEMMPARLNYLKSYFGKGRTGIGFYLSFCFTLSLLAAGVYFINTNTYPPTLEAEIVMLTTLVGLGTVEHLFMVLPVTDSKLWAWAMRHQTRSHTKNQTPFWTKSKNNNIRSMGS